LLYFIVKVLGIIDLLSNLTNTEEEEESRTARAQIKTNIGFKEILIPWGYYQTFQNRKGTLIFQGKNSMALHS